MRRVIVGLALLGGGCKSLESVTVVGSAFVESDRPEGKAVAKLEVRYTPPSSAPRAGTAAGMKDGQKPAPDGKPANPESKPATAAVGKTPAKTTRPTKPKDDLATTAGRALLGLPWSEPPPPPAPPR